MRDVADRGRGFGRIPADPLGKHLVAVCVWAGISNHVRVRGGVHFLHVAAAARSAGAGSDAHVCEPCGRGSIGMVSGARAFDDACGAGVCCDSGRYRAGTKGRARAGGESAAKRSRCERSEGLAERVIEERAVIHLS